MPTEARRPVVAGNWKMNGSLLLLKQMKQALGEVNAENVDIIVFPPAVFLPAAVSEQLTTGAQNISQHSAGAYTGEIACEMIKQVGATYCLVGHSERRELFAESNQVVAQKVAAVLGSNLKPVLCIGEPLSVREQGDLFGFLAAQLDAVIDAVGIDAFADIIVAYEPIWAIGTGKTASPEQAQQVHKFIREHIAALNSDIAERLRILYGGSVNAANAQNLFSQPDVDGGLVGGASLKSEEFVKICQAANK